MTGGLAEAADRLSAWLLEAAYPLWWEAGADPAGGFHEALDQSGAPVAARRRARVQCRQVFAYALAGRLGWSGPAEAAVRHGLAYIEGRYRRPDHLVRAAVGAEGCEGIEAARLYDQAFALLAFAEVERVLPGATPAREAAEALRAGLEVFRHDAGGFREADPEDPQQSNPVMHLFEAALAWDEVSADPAWTELADDLADLALGRFFGPEGGVREYFEADWTIRRGPRGRVLEPGHQFEWSWLLARYGVRRRRPEAVAAGARLYALGRAHGVDPARNVAIDEIGPDLAPVRSTARLWPQTERLKAALLQASLGATPAARAAFEADAEDAARGLELYLQTPVRGLWRDRLQEDGRFIEEPAPASSFYHIVCALSELRRHVGAGLDRPRSAEPA